MLGSGFWAGSGGRLLALSSLLLSLFSAGNASAQSENVTLLGQWNPESYYSGCWGYSASDGTELAVVGLLDGTAFVDVTDPASPRAAIVPGPRSGWREIRCAGHYAYISNEAGGGLQIVDLSDPRAPRDVGFYNGAFERCHSLHFDEGSGLLYCNGTNGRGGGLVVLDLTEPEQPVIAGGLLDPYVHDMYSRDGIGYLAAIYIGAIVTVDLTHLPDIEVLATTSYANGFTHNTWLTEDGNYLLSSDENEGGHLRIWDVRDPRNLSEVGALRLRDDSSIIHNVYVRGSYAYISWYTAGLQVIDVSDPLNPVRAGYYDTYNGTGAFNGAWGCFPFTASGNIYISDIQSGLYVLAFDSREGTAEGVVSDSRSALPIADVTVIDAGIGLRSRTRADGRFRLRLAEGVHRLRFERFGYRPDSLEVSIATNQVADGSIALRSLPKGSIAGAVYLLPDLLPIEGIEVTVEGGPSPSVSSVDGSFELPELFVGTYPISASRFGYVGARDTVLVREDQTTRVDFRVYASVLADAFEVRARWSVGAPSDSATSGLWVRADPVGTASGAVQPEDDHTPGQGSQCFVTGNGTPGGFPGEADVDEGRTTLMSPPFDLRAVEDPWLRYYRWFTNDAGAGARDDDFVVEGSSDDGETWIEFERLRETRAAWEAVEIRLSDFLDVRATVRVRFIASDERSPSLIEAAVDDVEIWSGVAPMPPPPPPSATRLLLPAPHPYRVGGHLRFDLAESGTARLTVYDISGRRVRVFQTGVLVPGRQLLPWDGRGDGGEDLPSGVYFQRLEAETSSEAGRFLLVR